MGKYFASIRTLQRTRAFLKLLYVLEKKTVCGKHLLGLHFKLWLNDQDVYCYRSLVVTDIAKIRVPGIEQLHVDLLDQVYISRKRLCINVYIKFPAIFN